MPKFIGRKVDLGIGRELTRGTGVAADMWLPKVDFSFDEKVIKARSVAGVGTIEDSEEAFVTTKFGEGEVGGEVRSHSFGFLLYSLFGTVVTTGPTDESFSHAFSLEETAQHDSLTFTVVDPNNTEAYDLVMLNSLELTAELDSILNFSASFMGKTSKGGAGTPSYTDEAKFTKRHLTYKTAAALAGLSAASKISLKALTLTFNQNILPDDVLGTAEPEDFCNQAWSVEGSVTLNYVDETYKNLMRNNTHDAQEISWTNTEETIGAGAINPSLTFQMPNVDYFDWEPNYALDEIVSQTISFKANTDVANSQGSVTTATLVNEKASY